MTKFELICKQYDIILTSSVEIYALYEPLRLALNRDSIEKTSCCVSAKKPRIKQNMIGLGSYITDITKWHELGHLVHPLGVMIKSPWSHSQTMLVNELAASAWALQNMDDVGVLTARLHLIEGFKSYIRVYGCNVPDTNQIRDLAEVLGITEQLNFKGSVA